VNSKVTQTTHLSPDTDRTGALDMATGATGPVMRAISRRRSHRQQWAGFEIIAMLILDTWLVRIAFDLAYDVRFNLIPQNTFLNTILNYIHTNLAENASHAKGGIGIPPPSSFELLRISIMIGLVAIFALKGLYKIRLTGTWFRQVVTIASSATIGLAVLITYFFVFQPPSSSRLIVPFVWAIAIVLLSGGRLIVSVTMGLLYRLGLGETRLLVVGSGRLGKMIMQHIAASPNLGYSIVGFLHDMTESPSDFGRFKMLGTLEDLSLVIRSLHVDEVIIALPSNMHEQSIKSVKLCEKLGASFKLVPDLYELSLSRIDMETIEGIPLIGIKQVSLNTVQRLITRAVDIVISTLIIVLGSPLWLFIALAIRLSSPGEIIYTQTRIGKNGHPFKIYKFRSMYKNAEHILAALWSHNEAQGPIFKMKDDPRTTTIGKFLRRTSLDEIPNLLSVLKGDMSLVGPRPPLPSEVAQYEEWQKGRLAIKPGMTGLWQVRGRSKLSFDEGVLMDLYYIENWSLRLYFMILFRTIPAVLFSRGAY
jgi:exopolysaccharide biosynthesis polyprenyl glycosylphosphotransferase